MNNKPKVKKISSCRVCKGMSLVKVFGLGPTPLANAFLTKNQIDLEEEFYPLDVYFCNNCSFIELGHVVSPDLLFSNYVYVSSTSQVFIDHFKNFAQDVFKKFNLKDPLVIDIGSNDGILLIPFKKLGARVLGIEPAKRIANVARKEGVETISEYFSVSLAKKIVKQKGKAKVVTATNVFAHIDNLDEVIRGLQILLDKDGVFIMEAPYLIDFIQKRYFDLVYHEHLSYWSIATLKRLFQRFDMKVFDVKKAAVHGGSIRVFVANNKSKYKIQQNVEKFLKKEKNAGLTDINTYKEYATKIEENKIKLLTLLQSLKIKGKKIVGFGAPAKGNTLLNFFSIGTETLDYIIDNNSWKQGLYSPGKRIPVVSPEVLKKDKVDYILILAWNFAESIMKNNRQFSKGGGHFIIPVPKPKII